MPDRPGPLPLNRGKTASQKAKRWRRWKWYVSFGTLGLFLLGLIGGEIGVRQYAARNSYFNICLGACDEWDPHRTFRLRKNYSIGGIKTNSKGILGPEFEAEKGPASFRIVTLGDSCSFVPVERNYPRVLEELLRETSSDVQIDVINASCPGYRSDQLRTWYEREIDGYEHDLLIIYVGWNDIGHPQLQETALIPPRPSGLQRLVSRSYLLRYLSYRQQRQARGPVSLAPLSADEATNLYAFFYPVYFERNLLAIINLAKSRNRQVFLLNRATLLTASPTEEEQHRMHFPVWMGRRLHAFLTMIHAYETALHRVARESDVAVIDIKSLFSSVEDRRLFTDSAHYNERGAEIIAARVAEAIQPHVEQKSQNASSTASSPYSGMCR